MQSLQQMQHLRVITAAVKGALREICQIEGTTPAELYRLVGPASLHVKTIPRAGEAAETQVLGYPLPYNPAGTTVLVALAELINERDESEG